MPVVYLVAYAKWNGSTQEAHHAPQGMVEREATVTTVGSPKATSVHIEFENGLKFDCSKVSKSYYKF